MKHIDSCNIDSCGDGLPCECSCHFDVSLQTLEVMGKLLESSGKEAERLNKECSEYKEKQAFIAGFKYGRLVGIDEQQEEIRNVLGLPTDFLYGKTEKMTPEQAYDLWRK